MTSGCDDNRTGGGRVVIGVGNAYRRDDGVGIVIARRVGCALPDVRVIESFGEGASLMHAWSSAEEVVLIDAVRSGAAPGKVHRLDAQSEKIPSDFFNYSTHAFSVAEAVEMARALNTLPPRFLIFGVEGEDFAAGAGLSPPVAAAVDEVAARIVNELIEFPLNRKGVEVSHA